MQGNVQKYGLLGLKVVAGLAFLAAGLAKLTGAEMMVGTFDAIGAGQWFRHVTGLIEVVAAILLFVPGRQAIGAGLLVCTMVGAILAHILVLGTDTMLPAVILLAISGLIAYTHRDQIAAKIH